MTPRSIRWHLFQVLLVTIVPIGLFAAALLYLHWQAQEEQREQSQIESVRLLATAVDNALESTMQRLSIFARVWAANPAGDAEIYAQARAALAGNPDWSNIVAFRVDGSGVFRADEAFGASVPAMRLLAQWRPVIEEQRAVVTDVFLSPVSGRKLVSVGVPVVRDGKVTHVLLAVLNLRWFDELMARQGRGGLAGVFDRNWKFVARTTEGEERRGSDGSAALVGDMKRAPEGIGRYHSLSGTGVYTSWTSTRHGWRVALATPSAPIESAFWTYLGALTLLWVAMVAVGIAYAVSKGRHIASALVSVEERARELAQAHRLGRLPASRVEEVSRALAALEQASERLQAAMRERDQSLATEQKARSAAEAANRAKDEFLAMLGHELRNPLAAIWSGVSILRSESRTPQQLDFAAGVIERQSRHLKRLIDDLLDVGRVMTGSVMIERAPVDLAVAVRHVATTLEAAGRFTQRVLQIDAAPVWVDGDQTRLEQIATNLLVNAVTCTAPGGSIRVRVGREGREAVLEVSDDGRGIAPENLERVFELFFQADATVDRRSGGLGIGLTLVRRLAGLHDGTVTAHSAGRNKGASFVVRLPAMAAAVQAVRAPAPAPARAVEPQTILVVEDNADERESLQVALELQGHGVLHAPDAHSALELLRQHRPPVAILDIGLPGMNGYELARIARAQLGDALLLVALTGYGAEADVQRAKAAGFDAHLIKPVEMQELIEVLERAPGARSNQRGLSADQKIA
jgi:signal transduction histidine kinase/ActR/RegA family two-component response regulator